MSTQEDNVISLIVTAKNRVGHFIQTFPSLITQYGSEYDLVFSDFHSTDNFLETLKNEAENRKEMFSPYLRQIRCIRLMKDMKFNPRKAKNLGVSGSDADVNILAFSDIDTFIGIDYLSYWSRRIEEGKSFFATRQQESRAALPIRIKPEINYGNVIVYKSDFLGINGWDESVNHYGGDDDDFFHRLKLNELREINPISHLDAKQYSILHGDELRTAFMEKVERVNKEEAFNQIYDNKEHDKAVCEYLSPHEPTIFHCIYERETGSL